MPLYEYRCADCGHELEILRKISDPHPVECPSCHHASLQKKLTAAGFQLKGTGWYATDFKGSGAAPPRSDKAAETPASGEAAAAAAPAAGTDSKSAGSPPPAATTPPPSAG